MFYEIKKYIIDTVPDKIIELLKLFRNEIEAEEKVQCVALDYNAYKGKMELCILLESENLSKKDSERWDLSRWQYFSYSKKDECNPIWQEVRQLLSKVVREFSKMSPGVYTDSIQNIYIEASSCLFAVEDYVKANFAISEKFELYVINPMDPENINWAETFEEVKYDDHKEEPKPEPPPCLPDLEKVVEYYELMKGNNESMSELYFFTRKLLDTIMSENYTQARLDSINSNQPDIIPGHIMPFYEYIAEQIKD